MPRSLQRKKLQRMAEQFQAAFTLDGLAETSFISTARFKGFSLDLIYQVASSYWPSGYAAGMQQQELNLAHG
ncbi:MAG: hypothetical protein GC154_18305 [bacterium]|nr:hypothetical protein [bacterium]